MDRKAIHYAVVLAVICVVAAAGVAGTYVVTRERIQTGEARERAASQKLACKATRFEATSDPQVFKALDDSGVAAGYVGLGEAQGYAGKVRVMAGMDAAARKLLNVVVVAQNETPGLGTRVCDVKSDRTWGAVLTGAAAPKDADTTPDFLKQFRGRAPDKLALKPALPDGVQAISGATISSRAVVNAAHDAVARIQAAAGAKPSDATKPPKAADAVTGATTHAAPPPATQPPSPGATPKP
jgi:RnfABCDGE-type electron transport complex G subunit